MLRTKNGPILDSTLENMVRMLKANSSAKVLFLETATPSPGSSNLCSTQACHTATIVRVLGVQRTSTKRAVRYACISVSISMNDVIDGCLFSVEFIMSIREHKLCTPQHLQVLKAKESPAVSCHPAGVPQASAEASQTVSTSLQEWKISQDYDAQISITCNRRGKESCDNDLLIVRIIIVHIICIFYVTFLNING